MKQFDQMGCPSIWLGFSGHVPERLYSPELEDMVEDEVFTNHVMSTIVNKIGSFPNSIQITICKLRVAICWLIVKSPLSNYQIRYGHA